MQRLIVWLTSFFQPRVIPDVPPPTRGVPIQLDRTRHLRYPLRVMKQIREEFGKEALADGVITEHLAKLIWYGLQHEDSEITLVQVEDLVDGQNLGEVSDAMVEAFGQKGAANPLVATPQVLAKGVAPKPSTLEMKT